MPLNKKYIFYFLLILTFLFSSCYKGEEDNKHFVDSQNWISIDTLLAKNKITLLPFTKNLSIGDQIYFNHTYDKHDLAFLTDSLIVGQKDFFNGLPRSVHLDYNDQYIVYIETVGYDSTIYAYDRKLKRIKKYKAKRSFPAINNLTVTDRYAVFSDIWGIHTINLIDSSYHLYPNGKFTSNPDSAISNVYFPNTNSDLISYKDSFVYISEHQFLDSNFKNRTSYLCRLNLNKKLLERLDSANREIKDLGYNKHYRLISFTPAYDLIATFHNFSSEDNKVPMADSIVRYSPVNKNFIWKIAYSTINERIALNDSLLIVYPLFADSSNYFSCKVYSLFDGKLKTILKIPETNQNEVLSYRCLLYKNLFFYQKELPKGSKTIYSPLQVYEMNKGKIYVVKEDIRMIDFEYIINKKWEHHLFIEKKGIYKVKLKVIGQQVM